MQVQDLLQQEYMSLAPDIGIIPEKFRNRAYDKLDFDAGEGGLSGLLADRQSQGGGDMKQFLAAIAAGADPQEYAKQMLGESAKPSRRAKAEPAA